MYKNAPRSTTTRRRARRYMALPPEANEAQMASQDLQDAHEGYEVLLLLRGQL